MLARRGKGLNLPETVTQIIFEQLAVLGYRVVKDKVKILNLDHIRHTWPNILNMVKLVEPQEGEKSLLGATRRASLSPLEYFPEAHVGAQGDAAPLAG